MITKKELNRKNLIFKLIDENLPTPQINARLDSYQKRQLQNEAKGKKSEKIVLERLQGLYYINRASITSGDQGQDRAGHDLRISLSGRDFEDKFKNRLSVPHNQVWVQVKSSQVGVEGWKNDLMIRHDLDENSLDEWLNYQRLVILDASLNPINMIESFESQLEIINHSWFFQENN